MKILAIEKENPEAEWKNHRDVLEEEARAVYNLYIEGSIREIYFTENKSAVLILECESIQNAVGLLSALPLVKNKMITFDIMELRPYTGFDRILK
jgi:hypothetical protein